MSLLTALAWGAGAFSALFSLAAVAAAFVYFKVRRRPAARVLPPVTILKPLKGVDRELYSCLESFCRLDYPVYQLVFTLASPDDPALPVVARLREKYPGLDMELVVSKCRIGLNPKINNVSNAAPFIKHDLLLLSDSDIRVEPGFLKLMAAALEDQAVGMATAFYRSAVPSGIWARLEALSVNAHFLPQAVMAAAGGMRFAMGAAMLVRREAFERAGGFRLMASHIADDFVLGRGVQKAGYGLEIVSCAVESEPDLVGPVEHVLHQTRWSRTIRVCDPRGYAGLLLLHGFSLLTLLLLAEGPSPALLAMMAAVLACKVLAAALVPVIAGQARPSLSVLLLLPLSEWLTFACWAAGFGGTKVLWRGERCDLAPAV